MSINYIENGEDGLSIRTKLNDLITIVNYYSSSQWPPTPPPGPASYTFTIYDNSPSTSGTMTSEEACGAYNGAYNHMVYVTKGGGNFNTMIIENGDTVYTDIGLTIQAPSNYYSYYSSQIGNSAYIQVGASGMVMTTTACAGGGGGGTQSTTFYSSMMASPMPEANPTAACSAIGSGFSHTVYFTKGAGNMDSLNLESGDFMYQDMGATSVLASGYYGFVQYAMNKWVLLGPGGVVDSITMCM